jgi:hypothetical protein
MANKPLDPKKKGNASPNSSGWLQTTRVAVGHASAQRREG